MEQSKQPERSAAPYPNTQIPTENHGNQSLIASICIYDGDDMDPSTEYLSSFQGRSTNSIGEELIAGGIDSSGITHCGRMSSVSPRIKHINNTLRALVHIPVYTLLAQYIYLRTFVDKLENAGRNNKMEIESRRVIL